ncbi:MAG: hypothetical protein ACLFRH_10110 [Halothiobacillaceae bacterium]
MSRGQAQMEIDLFPVPEAAPRVPGTMDYRQQVAHLVSEVLKRSSHDRYGLSAEISRLAGKDVSKNMLDAYASDAREDHNLPLYLVPAIETVCDSHCLTNWLVGVRGGKLLIGREALNAELGKLERARDEAGKRIRQLKQLMGEME